MAKHVTVEQDELIEVAADALAARLTVRDQRGRRERIATAVLAGMRANSWHPNNGTHEDFAAFAVAQADALIAELDK